MPLFPRWLIKTLTQVSILVLKDMGVSEEHSAVTLRSKGLGEIFPLQHLPRLWSYQVLLVFYQTAWRHIPADSNLHSHRCQNLKSKWATNRGQAWVPTNTVVNLPVPQDAENFLSSWTSTRILLHGGCYRSMEFMATHVNPRNLPSDKLNVKSLTRENAVDLHSLGTAP